MNDKKFWEISPTFVEVISYRGKTGRGPFTPPTPHPPILNRVNAIYEHMLYFQRITAKVNMKYVNNTLHVGVKRI